MTELVITHIVLDSSGKARIRDRGVAVKVIAEMHNDGQPVEQITELLDLTPAQVHAALSHYYDHKTDIDAAIQAGQALAATTPSIEEFKQRIEARRSP